MNIQTITGKIVVWLCKLIVCLIVLFAAILLIQWSLYARDRWGGLRDDDKLPTRAAVSFPKPDKFGDSFDTVAYLDQGWSPRQSLWFYNTTQGSDLMPYDFFLHLERADSPDLFRSPENINRYRYLVQEKTYGNPDGLPVGFVANTYRDRKYLGLTCAACHTSQVNVTATEGNLKGHNIGLRIDGGPAMSDMETFLAGLASALKTTLDDPEKRARFLKAIAGSRYPEQQILKDLQETVRNITNYNTMNNPVAPDGRPVAYGYARLDAFGRIYNRVLEHVIGPNQFGSVLNEAGLATRLDDQKIEAFATKAEQEDQPTHLLAHAEDAGLLAPDKTRANAPNAKSLFNSPNAPVSYPFLWDTPQHDYVQWNGVAANAGVGALGRNAGEVIGVFATLDWTEERNGRLYSLITGQGLKNGVTVNYQSSVDVSNLRRLEGQLAELQSPKWPAQYLGTPDLQKSVRGRDVYRRYCESCHAIIVRNSPSRRVVAHMDQLTAAKTDTAMAENSVNYQGASGMLRNQYVGTEVGNILLDEKAPVVALLTQTTKGVVLTTPDPVDGGRWWYWIRRPFEIVWYKTKRLFDFFLTYRDNVITSSSITQGNYQPDTTAAPFSSLRSYKARPLNGIWATAPYLHNGSVPDLYSLLLPQSERPPKFKVGSRQFDPVKVGFKSEGYDGFEFDTSIPGNANSGHEYGTGDDGKPALTPEQRWDLIEYLKTVGDEPDTHSETL